jgi:integrase
MLSKIPTKGTGMERKQLTDDLIAALAPKRKRRLVYDTEVRSLAVSVSPKGKKVFVVVKRLNGAKHASRRRLGIVGRIAVTHARELALKADMRPTGKFGDVCEDYFKRIAKHRRAWDVERTMRRELMPKWENKQIAAITRQDVIDVVNAVNARGTPYAAHHVLAYIKAFFSYATGNNLLEHSPADRVKPKVLIGAKEPRQRVLNDEELRAVWHAAERAGKFGKLVQLIIATGTRRSEAAGAQRDEFDTSAKLWRIPAERFKSNHAHAVPLSKLALGLIDSVPFGVTGFSKSKRRLDKFMLTELRKRNASATLPNWTLHDLRRTVRTRLTPITEYEVAEAVIGHGKTGLNKVYNLYDFIEEKRNALDNWAKRLQRIVTPDEKGKSAR